MRIFLLPVWIMLFCSSCFKKSSGCGYGIDNETAPSAEQQRLKNYIDSAGISAALAPQGFYYSILSGGSGSKPGPCSQITVAYKGKLTDGAIFDQQSNTVFTALGSLIDGWREGIPLIATGGEILLFIPPSLGYGAKTITDNAGNVVVPPNSILIFDISLTDVQ
jgi:FKBP-type peptidyl-prolyl cis-trans isomerase FkpA